MVPPAGTLSISVCETPTMLPEDIFPENAMIKTFDAATRILVYDTDAARLRQLFRKAPGPVATFWKLSDGA